MHAFKLLINTVSIQAIRLIEKEWIALHELIQEAGTADLDLESCRNVSGQVYSTGILHSQGLSAIGGRENGMTSPQTNLYESASTTFHRRRHLVVAL